MKNTFRILWVVLFVALIALIIQQATAQTQADAVSQIKNLNLSPIQSVQRWQCIGSGFVTAATGTGATATVSVVSPTSLTITIVSVGSNYVNPTATISGGTGSSGYVTVSFAGGVVTGINAPNATGYTVGDVLTVTITDNPVGAWNCGGLQMIKLTLIDGTVLGPYVNIPATAPEISNGGWVTMALGAPDPALLKRP